MVVVRHDKERVRQAVDTLKMYEGNHGGVACDIADEKQVEEICKVGLELTIVNFVPLVTILYLTDT
jgi:hypothetical protein